MLSALAGVEGEGDDKVCVECVSDTAQGRQPGLVLAALQSSDRGFSRRAASASRSSSVTKRNSAACLFAS
jgi:hypothetical protein